MPRVRELRELGRINRGKERLEIGRCYVGEAEKCLICRIGVFGIVEPLVHLWGASPVGDVHSIFLFSVKYQERAVNVNERVIC